MSLRPAEDEDIPMSRIRLRRGALDDLDAVNGIITRAIDTWQVSDRVKRLSLPSYHYRPEDLDHIELMLAMDGDRPVAVAAWEPAESRQVPAGESGLLLHGLYVEPDAAHQGVGSRLLEACRDAARERRCDGVLVKATRDAVGFFERSGLVRLPVTREGQDYDLRYWLAVDEWRPRGVD